MSKQSISCYQQSGLNSSFKRDFNDFESYIAHYQDIILRARTDLTAQNQDLILKANQPEQFVSNNKRLGILLIHGLFYSPYLMKSLFQHYQQKNVLVRSLLLPGHGTVPGDLLQVQYQDWINATSFAIDTFKKQVDHLVVMGISTGGLCALHQALLQKNISGLILFAPAIAIKNPFAGLAPILSRYKKWIVKHQETDYAHYSSITTNCVAQVYNFAKEVQKLSKKQNCHVPQFTIASMDDDVVSTPAIINYFEQYHSPKNFLLLYGNKQPSFSFNNYELRRSCYPDKKIIDFSHVCLTVAPNHPHYGEHGDLEQVPFSLCWYGKWLAKLNKNKPLMHGAASLYNLLHYRLIRLSYNPDFENMVQKIDRFIETLPGLND